MTDLSQAGVAFTVAITSFGARILGQAVDVLPEWLDRYGLPGMVIMALGYACLHLWKDGTKQREDRIKDRDGFIAKMEIESNKVASARDDMTRATVQQTFEFKNLCERIEKAITGK